MKSNNSYSPYPVCYDVNGDDERPLHNNWVIPAGTTMLVDFDGPIRDVLKSQRQALEKYSDKKFIVVEGTQVSGADNHIDRIVADYLNSGWDIQGNMFVYMEGDMRIFCQPMIYSPKAALHQLTNEDKE